MHTCYHSTQDLRKEGGQFNMSLSYRERLPQIVLLLVIAIFIQRLVVGSTGWFLSLALTR